MTKLLLRIIDPGPPPVVLDEAEIRVKPELLGTQLPPLHGPDMIAALDKIHAAGRKFAAKLAAMK